MHIHTHIHANHGWICTGDMIIKHKHTHIHTHMHILACFRRQRRSCESLFRIARLFLSFFLLLLFLLSSLSCSGPSKRPNGSSLAWPKVYEFVNNKWLFISIFFLVSAPSPCPTSCAYVRYMCVSDYAHRHIPGSFPQHPYSEQVAYVFRLEGKFIKS